jgi:hypothetical protein
MRGRAGNDADEQRLERQHELSILGELVQGSER